MRGQIYIEAGAITHAAVGALAGEKAFNRLLSLKGGEFHLKPFKAPPQRTLQGGWEVLLLEAARAYRRGNEHDHQKIRRGCRQAGRAQSAAGRKARGFGR